MATLMPSRCFAPSSTNPSFPPKVSPISTRRVPGRPASCAGTTSIIVTAVSVMSALPSAMAARIRKSWQPDMPSTARPANSTPHAGLATLETGRLSGLSPSTPNAIASSRHIRQTTISSRWLHDRGDNYLDARRWCARAIAWALWILDSRLHQFPVDKRWKTRCVSHRLSTGRRLPTSSTALDPICIKSGIVKTISPEPALAYSTSVAVQATVTTAEKSAAGLGNSGWPNRKNCWFNHRAS